jgi:hypothetical protein
VKFLRSIFGEADEAGQSVGTVDSGPDPVMAALAELEVKRLRQALAAASPAPVPEPPPQPESDVHVARPNRVVKAKTPLPEGVAPAARSIWDIDEETPKPVSHGFADAGAGAPSRRPTRTLRPVSLGSRPNPPLSCPCSKEPRACLSQRPALRAARPMLCSRLAG